jgi:dihydroorotase
LIEKAVEFDRAANGVIGLETSVPLGLKLVDAGILDISGLIEKMSTNPARILGLAAGLKIGLPADITVIDLELSYQIDAGRFQSLSRNTPFDKWDVKGKAMMTLVGGRIVFCDKNFKS